MTAKDIVVFWKTDAADTWDTAQKLYEAKKYHYALFFCHLAIEKLLKGLVYKQTDDPPPKIHKLVTLAQLANISLTGTQQGDMAEITGWNIEARYESYKREFYKKATKTFTEMWMQKAKKVFV